MVRRLRIGWSKKDWNSEGDSRVPQDIQDRFKLPGTLIGDAPVIGLPEKMPGRYMRSMISPHDAGAEAAFDEATAHWKSGRFERLCRQEGV